MWRPRRHALSLAVILLSGVALSCGDDGGGKINGPAPNASPHLLAIPDQVVFEGQTINTTLSATDADGDRLIYTIPTNPGFMSIKDIQHAGNTTTATCVMTPTQQGTYGAAVRVEDGKGGVDSQAFTITVERPPIEPLSGLWQAPTGFGTLELTVNPERTGITKIVFRFQSWRCGSVTRNGSASVTRTSGAWEIDRSSGQFTIPANFGANLTFTVAGTFSSNTAVSGTWTAHSYGTVCSGSWSASR